MTNEGSKPNTFEFFQEDFRLRGRRITPFNVVNYYNKCGKNFSETVEWFDITEDQLQDCLDFVKCAKQEMKTISAIQYPVTESEAASILQYRLKIRFGLLPNLAKITPVNTKMGQGSSKVSYCPELNLCFKNRMNVAMFFSVSDSEAALCLRRKKKLHGKFTLLRKLPDNPEFVDPHKVTYLDMIRNGVPQVARDFGTRWKQINELIEKYDRENRT